MYVVVDFDGSCVTHEYPKIGKDIGAVPVLKALVENGHKIILSTMRSDKEQGLSGKTVLQEAVDWFEHVGIPLYGVNENPDQKSWTSSPKVYGHVYIDDAALGCPLCWPENERPFVDWAKVSLSLITRHLISSVQIPVCKIRDIQRNLIENDSTRAK